MPAMLAAPRFVLSISDTQYRIPSVVTRRRSTRRMMRFCSSGVNSCSDSVPGEPPPAGYVAALSRLSRAPFSLYRSIAAILAMLMMALVGDDVLFVERPEWARW